MEPTTVTIIVAIIGGLLGGSAVAALINQIGEGIREKQGRKAKKEDKEDDDVKALKEGLKWVLYDRIRYLGQKYCAEGKIDFDDRRILHLMHDNYHNGLGGNGDLDALMKQVDRLQLK